MTFPLVSLGQGLGPVDFDLLAIEFSRIILHYIPYAEGPVTFLALPEGELSAKDGDGRPAA